MVRGLVAVVAIGACYNPRPFPGAPCAANGECPSGLVCSANACVLPGGADAPSLDVALTADGSIDGVGSDGGTGNGSCTAYASYTPDFGSNQVAYDYAAEGSEEWYGYLNTNPMPDVLYLELYAGYGVFSSGSITTGTFAISGNETNSNICGICGWVLTQVNLINFQEKDQYFWDSGTLQLTSVSGTLSGTLENAQLHQIDYNTQGSQITDPSGCMTYIGSASFSAPLQDGDGFSGGAIRVLVHRQH